MITLEDHAKVCRDILLRGITRPDRPESPVKMSSLSPTPVQKFLQRTGELPSGAGVQFPPRMAEPKAKAAAKVAAKAAPEQKRSWLRIAQQVWTSSARVAPTTTSASASPPRTAAGAVAVAATLNQIMAQAANEQIQQQLDALLNIGSGEQKLETNSGQEGKIIYAIIEMSKILCRLCRPILSKNGYGDGGLRSFSLFFGAIEEATILEDVSRLLGSLQYVLWMGPEGRPPRRAQLRAVASSLQLAFAHHAALPPLERYARSHARTVALVEMLLREYARGVRPVWATPEAQRARALLVWVWGAQRQLEGALAESGYYEEAAAFLSGSEERLHLCLLGDFTDPWAPSLRRRVRVTTGSIASASNASSTASAVDLVFCPHGRAEEVAKALQVASERSCVLAVSSCSEEEAEDMLRRLEKCGCKAILRKVRNLFSSMAAGSAAKYDAHGWISAVEVPAGATLETLEEPKAELQSAKDEAKAAKRSPAVFWGILDLKYDPSLPMERRVKVLETGDGRSSKFSGYGAAIKENFKADKKLEETLHRAVLVENKKLTHDFFVESGYQHLMPKQLCFRRIYQDFLALDIIQGLGLSTSGSPSACVLKLCNRARGAGCIPISADDLDVALERLLTLPDNTEEWLEEQDENFPKDCEWGCFEEQVRHWWSNECPVFVCEELCHSAPVWQEGKGYDATMRVGFFLTPSGRA
ncbi:unnamed protein product [Durusdinium trenchii]|uniref:Uncharacterized protein n=1 Tax=Durusdinium trenchii TaxID=1381693 RepID=A0ABP0NST0_9DINO